MGRKLVYSAIAAMLLCAACGAGQSVDTMLVATAEYLEANPLPTPQFFVIGDRGYISYECFEIDGKALWEPGDGFADGISYLEDVKSRMVVTVDGIVVPPENLDISLHLAPNYILDSEFNIIGTAGFLPSCILTDYLASGLHIAAVEVTTTFGIKHSYTWAFRVVETSSEMPTAFILPSVLPSTTPDSSPTP